MHTATNSVGPELSRLTKIRPVTKILQNGSFRENLESMVITYKLSMTENRLLRNTALPEPVPITPLRSLPKRDSSDVIGDASRFKQLSSELKLSTVKLAVACRLIDHFGWYQPILTHCSVRTESQHTVFTPLCMLFSKAKATNLLILASGSIIPTQEVDRNSLQLHQHLHSHSISCVITVNTPVCAAIASLRYGLLPLSKDFLEIGEIEYTDADSLQYYVPEGRVIFIRNQGLAVVGGSVEEAFYRLFHVLTACSVQAIALSAGADKILPMRHDLHPISHTVRDTPTLEMYQTHFEHLSKLVTEDSISSLAGTNCLQFQPEIENNEINAFPTNPFLPLALTMDTYSNPFLPLADETVDHAISFVSRDIISDQSSMWDFTRYLYPSEDVWNFLPQPADSISNPITQNTDIPIQLAERLAPVRQIHTGDDDYDDLV